MKFIKKIVLLSFLSIVLLSSSATAGLGVNGVVSKKQVETVVAMYQCEQGTCNSMTNYYFLTITRSDGTKVKAECVSDPMIQEFNDASIGDTAYGEVVFEGGYGTWVDLVITHQQ